MKELEALEVLKKLFKEEWIDLACTIVQHMNDYPKMSKQDISLNINDLIRDFADFEKLKVIGASEIYILQRKILKELYDSFYVRATQFLFQILVENHKDQECVKNYKKLNKILNNYPFYGKMFILSNVLDIDPFETN